MKSNTKNKTNKHNTKSMNIYRCYISLVAIGIVLLVLPLISLLVDTQQVLIKYATRIEKDSEIYKLLQQEIAGAFVHMYIFNVTNGDAFISGHDHKLKLQEVGPFVYREYRKNEQFEVDEKAGVMRYTPHLWMKFLPEDSIADPHMVNVTVPNASLLAMASMLSDQPYWLKSTYNLLVWRVRSKALVNLDVHSHLWGYEEPLITVGHTLLPGWITFDKMGLLDRLYDKAAVPRLELGSTSKDKFRIKTINGARGLNVWEYENPSKRSRCNTVEDTYEGIAYPPGLTPETPLRVYRNVFCRMLDLQLVGTRTMDFGPEAFVYRFSNDSFKFDGTTNECLCGHRSCKTGVTDLSPCLYNLPMTLSNGHFLNGDPQLYERIEGISPNEKTHGSEFVIDPKMGVVLKTYFTLQVNVDVGNVAYNPAAKPFSNMMVPIAYFKIIQADMPEEDKEKFRLYYFKVIYVIRGLEICLLVLGTLCLIGAVRKIYWNVFCTKRIGYQISARKNAASKVRIEEPLMDETIKCGQLRVFDSEDY